MLKELEVARFVKRLGNPAPARRVPRRKAESALMTVKKLIEIYGDIHRGEAKFREQCAALEGFPEFWPDKRWGQRRDEVLYLFERAKEGEWEFYSLIGYRNHYRSVVGKGYDGLIAAAMQAKE